MPLKGHRSSSTGRLGRTSSATKIANNLQFTQKDLPVSKHADKQKKSAGYANDKLQPPGRVNSSQRIQPREQMLAPKRANPPQKTNGGRTKGFTISSPTDGGDDDEDEWISSSSGAVTPNHHDSDSETASENDASEGAPMYTHHAQPPPVEDHDEFPPLQRIDTARPSDFMASTPRNDIRVQAPPPPDAPPHFQPYVNPPRPDDHHPDVHHIQEQIRHLKFQNGAGAPSEPVLKSSLRHPHGKRASRPSSTYSNSGKPEVRPHPLIRGQSFGRVDVGKPMPLSPLTLAAPPQLSTSPTSSVSEDPRNFLSSSPASTKAGSFSDKQDRRTSFSSVRSANTVPTRMMDRNRTLSTTSSSAALSALSHLPTVTRPPSPQAIVFFPPVNPHVSVENIHPLLPGPYLHNHLTVLSRRIPLRESYDRVIRAKQAM